MNARLTVLGFTPVDELEQARLTEARRLLPGVDLHVEEGPLDESAFVAASANGDVPDLLYVDRDLIGGLAARGLLRPIDALIDGNGIERRQFRDAALRALTFRGELYGIPDGYDSQFLVLHLPALASASVYPREVEFGDWVLLPEANRRLTVQFPTGLGRAGVETGLPESLPLWARANEADLLSPDGRTAQLDDPRVVAALEAGMALIDDQGGWDAVRAFHDELEPSGPNNPFARNRVGVMAVDASYLDELAEESPHLQIVVKPIVDRRGAVIPFISGMAWLIPAAAPDPARSFDAAWALSRPETWVVGARARRDAARDAKRRFAEPYTANKDADLAIWKTVSEPSGMGFWDTAVGVVRTYQETGVVLPPSAAPREVRAAWTAGVRRALRREVEPARALRDANARAQAALDATG